MKRIILAALVGVLVSGSAWGYGDDNKFIYYNNIGPTDLSGLQPGQDFQTIIRRFRNICSSCSIMQETNEFWTLYMLRIRKRADKHCPEMAHDQFMTNLNTMI